MFRGDVPAPGKGVDAQASVVVQIERGIRRLYAERIDEHLDKPFLAVHFTGALVERRDAGPILDDLQAAVEQLDGDRDI